MKEKKKSWFNPKMNDFLEDNPELTLIGFIWATIWRAYTITFAIGFAIGFLGLL